MQRARWGLPRAQGRALEAGRARVRASEFRSRYVPQCQPCHQALQPPTPAPCQGTHPCAGQQSGTAREVEPDSSAADSERCCQVGSRCEVHCAPIPTPVNGSLYLLGGVRRVARWGPDVALQGCRGG